MRDGAQSGIQCHNIRTDWALLGVAKKEKGLERTLPLGSSLLGEDETGAKGQDGQKEQSKEPKGHMSYSLNSQHPP